MLSYWYPIRVTVTMQVSFVDKQGLRKVNNNKMQPFFKLVTNLLLCVDESGTFSCSEKKRKTEQQFTAVLIEKITQIDHSHIIDCT